MGREKGRQCQVVGCARVAAADVLLSRLPAPVEVRDVRGADGMEAGLRVCLGCADRLGTIVDLSAEGEPGEEPCVVVWVAVERAAGWRLVSELVSSGAYERLVLYPPETSS